MAEVGVDLVEGAVVTKIDPRLAPIVQTPADPERRLSFRNLIELAALRALRTEHGFKLSAVRDALAYARHELGIADLLSSRDLYAQPGELFLSHYGHLISLNRAGQLGIRALLEGLLKRIQWDKKLAVRFFPAVPNRPEARSIMLDPTVSFGHRPVIRTSMCVRTHTCERSVRTVRSLSFISDIF